MWATCARFTLNAISVTVVIMSPFFFNSGVSAVGHIISRHYSYGLHHQPRQRVPSAGVFTVQVTETSSSRSNYDSCQSEVVTRCYGAAVRRGRRLGWRTRCQNVRPRRVGPLCTCCISLHQERTACFFSPRATGNCFNYDEEGPLSLKKNVFQALTNHAILLIEASDQKLCLCVLLLGRTYLRRPGLFSPRIKNDPC